MHPLKLKKVEPSTGVRLALTLALLLAAGGCAGYKLGSTLPADIRTVFIPVFANETDEPLVENEVTREVVARIQRDGALRIAPEAAADAVLKVSLKRFIFTPLAYARDQRERPNEYRMIVTASFVLYRRSTGEVLTEHPAVQGEALVQVVGDLSTSKRFALPDASRDLARDLTEKILEAWN